MFSNYLLTTITVVLLYCIKWELFAANNVLFVVFDDLRPALGGYNDPWAKTPHLDNILVKGHYFTRAYSQVKGIRIWKWLPESLIITYIRSKHSVLQAVIPC